MQRNIKRTLIVVMTLITVLLLVSPVVFARPVVRIDDEGELKGLRIKTSIIKGNDIYRLHGPNCGKVQAIITEVPGQQYTYRFSIDFKKALPETDYGISVWADLPEEVVITIYGNGNGLWPAIELVAYFLEIDDNPFDRRIEASIGEWMTAFGFTDPIIELDTGLTFKTDILGEYHNTKTGSIEEDKALEYVLDLAWPKLRTYLLSILPPGPVIPEEIDFDYLGIVGLWVHGGQFSVSGGLRIIELEGPEGPPIPDGNNNFHTVPVTIDRFWNDFKWGMGPPP